MTTLKVGIASVDEFKNCTMAIVRGEHKRTSHDPKLWLSSIDSFAKILSEPCADRPVDRRRLAQGLR